MLEIGVNPEFGDYAHLVLSYQAMPFATLQGDEVPGMIVFGG